MKKGFTLAEVLITLGIIGVVAAMTIPSIIQSYKKKSFSAQLLKTYNTVLNTFRLSEDEHGDMSGWTIPNLGNLSNGSITHVKFFDTYIKPYIKYHKVVYGNSQNADIKVYLNDGSSLSFHPGAAYDIVMDVNGDKSPNAGGKDVYTTYIVNNKISNLYNVSREQAKSKCKANAGSSDSGGYCFLILKHDNFEFEDDYPIKL